MNPFLGQGSFSQYDAFAPFPTSIAERSLRRIEVTPKQDSVGDIGNLQRYSVGDHPSGVTSSSMSMSPGGGWIHYTPTIPVVVL